MNWFLAGVAVGPLLPAALLTLLLRRLRRAGRPDRGAERMVAMWTLVTVVSALVALACPDPPHWIRVVLVGPPLLIGFGFMIHRIRKNPTALFAPQTVDRLGRCRGHR